MRTAKILLGILNEIEDYLEYRYKQNTTEGIRDTVLLLIDQGISKLTVSRDKGEKK